MFVPRTWEQLDYLLLDIETLSIFRSVTAFVHIENHVGQLELNSSAQELAHGRKEDAE